MTTVIVTGVDGSDTAARGARRAAGLAHGLGGELHVLTAYGVRESTVYNDGVEKVVFADVKKAEKTACEAVENLREFYPELKISYAASEGSPSDALIAAARALHADIIVVGNKRVQGIARILGSIAKSVAAHAPCDLYIANTAR